MFLQDNSDTHLRDSECLRKYTVASEAKRLSHKLMRQNLWLLSQIMSLKENELDQLAKFMGHDIRVHRECYWLTKNTFQIAKIS